MSDLKSILRRPHFGSLATVLIFAGITATFAQPDWWSSPHASNPGDPINMDFPAVLNGNSINNHGPANIGQAKHVSRSALLALRASYQTSVADYIESQLVGEIGGRPLKNWNAPANDTEKEQQKVPLLLGQLKSIAHPFYNYYNTVSPNWVLAQIQQNHNNTAVLGTHFWQVTGNPNYVEGGYYPWNPDTPVAANKAIATIGQLKAVFSLSFDRGETVFSEDFENPDVSATSDLQYGATIDLGQLPNNGHWVGSSAGYGATRKGMIRKIFGDYSAPDANNQGMYFGYTNTGLTTSISAMSADLDLNKVYTLSFDVAKDNDKQESNYRMELVAFGASDDDASRSEARPSTKPGTVLASVEGVVTTNDMSEYVSIVFEANPYANINELGKSLGIRFIGNASCPILDNVKLTIVDKDSDGDEIEDAWEIANFGDLTHDGTLDTDGDRLSDAFEYGVGLDPNDTDTDDDGNEDWVGFLDDDSDSDPDPDHTIVFSEDFETPNIANTSTFQNNGTFDVGQLPSGGNWVGATSGYGADSWGIVHKGFTDFTAPYTNNQAMYFGYTNSGITSSVSAISQTLELGATYTLTFDIARDNDSAQSSYLMEIVAFAPEDDDSVRNNMANKSGYILASAGGVVQSNDLSETVTIIFSPDDEQHASHLGKSMGIRFVGNSSHPILDNVELKIVGFNNDQNIVGTDSADFLVGANGDDTLVGKEGDDTLSGGTGNDLYRWHHGDGHDLITDAHEGNLETSKLRFGKIQSMDQVVLELGWAVVNPWQAEGGYTQWTLDPNGADLRVVVTYDNQPELSGSIIIQDWVSKRTEWEFMYHFGSNSSGNNGGPIFHDYIETLNGGSLGTTGHDTISIYAGMNSLDGKEGDDTLQGSDSGDSLYGATGDDLHVGGQGDDRMYGSSGNDTYEWRWGDGHDYISDTSYTSPGYNVVSFPVGVTQSDVTFERGLANSTTPSSWSIDQNKYDLRIVIGDGPDSTGSGTISINSWTSNNREWKYMFSDGSELLGAELVTASDDHIYGTDFDDTYYSSDGDDHIEGEDGNDILYGEAGNDRLDGDNGDDQLYGGEGNDDLNGSSGDDLHVGGLGDDRMYGSSGNDTYEWRWGDGHDYISDTSSTSPGYNVVSFPVGVTQADVTFERGMANATTPSSWSIDQNKYDLRIVIGDGPDSTGSGTISINSWTSNNKEWKFIFSDSSEILGAELVTSSDDHIYGTDFDDTYYSSDGDDHIEGEDGNDILYGEAGNDELYGDNGNDQLFGGEGNDELNGNSGDDLHVGGLGDDRMHGSSGNDTYEWRWGDGHDYIYDPSYTSPGYNIVYFPVGVTQSDVTFERGLANATTPSSWSIDQNKYDLRIVIGDSPSSTGAGTISINSWTSNNKEWKLIFSDGSHILGAELGTNGDDHIYGTDFDDTYYSSDGDDHIEGEDGNDVLYGEAGNDRLDGDNGDDQLFGGVGDDELYGGYGDDTYHWDLGDGHDYINDTQSSSTGTNVLKLGNNISINDLIFEKGNSVSVESWMADASGRDLRVYITQNGDPETPGSIIIESWQNNTTDWKIIFADSSELLATQFGTSGDDTLSGTSGIDTLNGSHGDDDIKGGDGDDLLYGEAGNDELRGESGNDSLFGGEGSDKLYGSSGNDILDGGLGNDYLDGGSDNDTYLWNYGDGDDYVADTSSSNGGNNILRLGAGITPDHLLFEYFNVSSSNYLEITIPEISGSDIKISITNDTLVAANGSFLINSAVNSGDEWIVEFTELDPNGISYPSITHATMLSLIQWDTDSDGMPDWWERLHELPTDIDNSLTDTDGDGLTDLEEWNLGTLPQNVDSDGDGVDDKQETLLSSDPLATNIEYLTDTDGDGLSNGLEIILGYDPNVADQNNNGVIDGIEHALGIDLNSLDPDGDGLDTLQEQALGTSPFLADSDGDGVNDDVDLNPTDPTVSVLIADPANPSAPVINLIVPTATLVP